MIAGALPVDTNANYGSPTGPQGSGSVDIYNNLIQANQSNDDGGGIRFLMAGNFPMNVYNNMIVNNVSTHEGGGVAIDDAPNVRFFNNTVMKNITTNTAVTANANQPAPAGLSTAANSTPLRNTLPGNPAVSPPLLFNDSFWDNRAGTRSGSTVIGIGLPGDATQIRYWDLGFADASGTLTPTNSVIQLGDGSGVASNPTAGTGNPGVVAPFDTVLTFQPWRNVGNAIAALMVTQDVAPSLLGDYHLATANALGSNLGAGSKGGVTRPATDIDGDARSANAPDIGADEFGTARGITADLAITKTDGLTSVIGGQPVTYTIVVTNNGPNAVSAAVTDTLSNQLTNVNWTCAAVAPASCTASGIGNITAANAAVVLPGTGAHVTFTVTANVIANPTIATLVNTATVAIAGAGITDPVAANNTATDTDTIAVPTNLVITKTDGLNTVLAGNQVTYTIVVTKPVGAFAVNGAQVVDTLPTELLAGANWTCNATGAGYSCGVGGGSGAGNINRSINLGASNTGNVTYTVTRTVNPAALAGNLSNTATVTAPVGITETSTSDNTATDTTNIVVPPSLPVLPALDTFNRVNAVNLGANWSQANNNIRLNSNNAQENAGGTGSAIWNGVSNVFGASQGAAFTIANGTFNNDALFLKGTDGSVTAPLNRIRVRYTTAGGPNRIVVETTTNSGGAYNQQGTALNTTFTNGQTLTATVDASGLVSVWQNSTFLGSVQLPNNPLWTTGGGRIGIQLPNGARVDNFNGGNV